MGRVVWGNKILRRPIRKHERDKLFKQTLLLTLTICAAASLVIFQPAHAQISEFKLLPSDGAEFDKFGRSVSISGDYAVAGALWDDDNGSDAGSAYLYSGFASPIGIEREITGLPAEFALSQNYPNPFNPSTVIRYALPKASDISLVIYNLRGQEVRRWDIQGQTVGYHQVNWDASSVASGIYFYRLQAGDFVQTRKMVLLK